MFCLLLVRLGELVLDAPLSLIIVVLVEEVLTLKVVAVEALLLKVEGSSFKCLNFETVKLVSLLNFDFRSSKVVSGISSNVILVSRLGEEVLVWAGLICAGLILMLVAVVLCVWAGLTIVLVNVVLCGLGLFVCSEGFRFLLLCLTIVNFRVTGLCVLGGFFEVGLSARDLWEINPLTPWCVLVGWAMSLGKERPKSGITSDCPPMVIVTGGAVGGGVGAMDVVCVVENWLITISFCAFVA